MTMTPGGRSLNWVQVAEDIDDGVFITVVKRNLDVGGKEVASGATGEPFWRAGSCQRSGANGIVVARRIRRCPVMDGIFP